MRVPFDPDSNRNTNTDDVLDKFFLWVPRIGGIITLISSIFMAITSFRKGNHMFHRMVFGKPFHLQSPLIGLYDISPNFPCTE